MPSKNGFREIVKKERGENDYEGDRFGGTTGSDGSGLPDSYTIKFCS